MATLKKIKQNIRSVGKVVEIGALEHCWWEFKMVQFIWKTVWWPLKKWKIVLPRDPTILLLGMYPKELKTVSWKDIGTPMFTAAFSQLLHADATQVSTDGQLDEQNVYVYTMQYYSGLNRKAVLTYVTT